MVYLKVNDWLSVFYKYGNKHVEKKAPGILGHPVGAFVAGVPLISGIIVFLYVFFQWVIEK